MISKRYSIHTYLNLAAASTLALIIILAILTQYLINFFISNATDAEMQRTITLMQQLLKQEQIVITEHTQQIAINNALRVGLELDLPAPARKHLEKHKVEGNYIFLGLHNTDTELFAFAGQEKVAQLIKFKLKKEKNQLLRFIEIDKKLYLWVHQPILDKKNHIIGYLSGVTTYPSKSILTQLEPYDLLFAFWFENQLVMTSDNLAHINYEAHLNLEELDEKRTKTLNHRYTGQPQKYLITPFRLYIGNEYLTIDILHSLSNHQNLLDRLSIIFIILTTIIMAVMLFFLNFFKKLIILPILNLAYVAEDIRQKGEILPQHQLPIHRTDEIGYLASAFSDMVLSLQSAKEMALESSRLRSRFLANMSHELRTPLNAILGYGELLKDEAEDLAHDDCIDDLNKILSSGQHLLRLITDILDFSKIESGKLHLVFEEVLLDQHILEVINLIKPHAVDKQLVVSCRCDEHLPKKITTDTLRLKQILYNLLSNAIKFTPENGQVVLALKLMSIDEKEQLANVQFSVTDTGIGIPKEKMQEIFDSFRQADISSTRRYGGTGLGLNIANHLVELLGGEGIAVESQEGKGSCFYFILPLDISKYTVHLADNH